MIKPMMNLKMDAEMTVFLATEMERLLDYTKQGRYSNEMLRNITHFSSQFKLQLDEQNVKLQPAADQAQFLIRTTIPEAMRVPAIPPRMTFLMEDRPIGEIQAYDSDTGEVFVNVLDPKMQSDILEGIYPQFEVLYRE